MNPWLIRCALSLLLTPPIFAATQIRFRDATVASGIRFVHSDGNSGKRYIVETVASGLGLLDYDGDGYLDILFLSGGSGTGNSKPTSHSRTELYHNNRDGTFSDVTSRCRLDMPGYGLGCAVADYDNDGHEDIFITNYGAHRLLHNNGNGTFTDVTVRA